MFYGETTAPEDTMHACEDIYMLLETDIIVSLYSEIRDARALMHMLCTFIKASLRDVYEEGAHIQGEGREGHLLKGEQEHECK